MPTLTLSKRLSFTSTQKKVLLALASMVGLRMLGLFLVLPVFTLYGLQFTTSKFLVGFAFGAYALVMAILQIPMGRLSDRIGRRRVLTLGMTLFSLGSFLCALPQIFPYSWQIWVLIFGRFVQGGGAVISVAFATVADYVQPEQRSTAMAMLGIPIGVSFIIGIVVGPILAGWFGTASLFWITGILGLATDVPLVRFLRDERPPRETPTPLSIVFLRSQLLVYGIGAFLMNLFMATFYFHMPLIITGQHKMRMTDYYKLLLPMLIISAVMMFGFSRGTDKGWGRPLSAVAFLFFIPSFLMWLTPSEIGLDPHRLVHVFVGGLLFYIGFTGLEPILPALVSEAAPGTSYGTALGFYNTLQFMGSAVGGPMAGYLARFPLRKTVSTVLIGAAVGFVLMAVTKSPARGAAAESPIPGDLTP